MLARSLGPALALAFVASLPVSASAQANGTQANGTGIREVSATGRSLITLQTRVRYTTMVLLPDGEEILDVICGDRDYWVITATHNIAHVKPAKEGAATNMNLVTASGAVYSFLLTEKGGTGMPDLKVYVNADPSAPQGKPKYYSAAQLEELRSELEQARAATDAANRRTTEALGFPINLHRFRIAAGNLWSIADPANVRGVKDLLGQTKFGTTEKHYIGGQSRLAGRALAKVLSGGKSIKLINDTGDLIGAAKSRRESLYSEA